MRISSKEGKIPFQISSTWKKIPQKFYPSLLIFKLSSKDVLQNTCPVNITDEKSSCEFLLGLIPIISFETNNNNLFIFTQTTISILDFTIISTKYSTQSRSAHLSSSETPPTFPLPFAYNKILTTHQETTYRVDPQLNFISLVHPRESKLC